MQTARSQLYSLQSFALSRRYGSTPQFLCTSHSISMDIPMEALSIFADMALVDSTCLRAVPDSYLSYISIIGNIDA